MDKFNINGLIYDNIGILKINNHTYIFIKNGSNIKIIEEKKTLESISYMFPNIDTKDIEELKGILFLDGLSKSLIEKIDSGLINSNDELNSEINRINDMLEKDDNLKTLFSSSIEEFKQNLKNIYAYLDKNISKDANLNLEGITSFKIEKNGTEKEYIKKYDEKTGDVEILENIDDKNFVEQFKDTQEKYASLNGTDGKINANETFNMMKKHEKQEVNLEAMDEIDKAPTRDDATSYYAMNSNYINNNERNMVASLDSGIYIDTNTGDTMTTEVKGSNISIKLVDEQNAIHEEAQNENLVSDDSTSYLTPTDITEELSSDEIERILVTRKNSLTEEQIKLFEEMLENKRKQEMNASNISLSNDKRLTFNNKNKYTPYKRAAFINLIGLCLFVQIFFLLGILVVVIFIK